MKKNKLQFWTVFFSPADFPGKYVARRFDMDQPTEDFFSADEVELVRDWIAQQAVQHNQGVPHIIPRQPGDLASVVEVWF